MGPLRAAARRVRRSRLIAWLTADTTPRGLLLLATFTLGFLALRLVLRHRLDTLYGQLVEALFEAFIVSFVLTISADTYLKGRLVRGATQQWLWALFNSQADPAHRQHVESMARDKTLYRRQAWVIEFSEVLGNPQVVRLDIEVTTFGISYEESGFRPSGRPMLLASTEDYESEYLYYSIRGTFAPKIPGQAVVLEAGRHDSRDIARYLEREDDCLLLNQDSITKAFLNDSVIETGTEFTTVRRTRVFRHVRGFFPLITGKACLGATLEVRGAALADLAVSVIVGGGENGSIHLNPEVPLEWDYTPPRQMQVLRWKRLANPLPEGLHEVRASMPADLPEA